jgi:Domain of unknown function (DUF5076)
MTMRDPDNPPPVFDALHIPPAAMEQGGTEVMRAVIVEGELHLSLRRAFEDPETWGMLLADVARHVGRLYASESAASEQDVIDRLRAVFESEMDEPSEPGTTNVVS